MNKKLIKNTIILTLAAITLVTATVLTTVAYLVSTAKVSNVFTVGDVTIEMYESHVDANGHKIPLAPGAKKSADTNSYAIVPGGTYDKDPTIYIKPDSAETILFVKTRNQISNIEIPENNDLGKKTMRQQMEENGWIRVAQTSIGDWIYVYAGDPSDNNETTAYAEVIGKSSEVITIDLFETFTIDPNCNTEEYKLAQGAAVTLTAYAIQADGFSTLENQVSKTDVIKAWNAIVGKVSYEAGNEIPLP